MLLVLGGSVSGFEKAYTGCLMSGINILYGFVMLLVSHSSTWTVSILLALSCDSVCSNADSLEDVEKVTEFN